MKSVPSSRSSSIPAAESFSIAVTMNDGQKPIFTFSSSFAHEALDFDAAVTHQGGLTKVTADADAVIGKKMTLKLTKASGTGITLSLDLPPPPATKP